MNTEIDLLIIEIENGIDLLMIKIGIINMSTTIVVPHLVIHTEDHRENKEK